MTALLRELWQDDSGQALVEYALVVGLAAVAVIGSVVIFRQQLIALWSGFTNSLTTAVTTSGSGS